MIKNNVFIRVCVLYIKFFEKSVYWTRDIGYRYLISLVLCMYVYCFFISINIRSDIRKLVETYKQRYTRNA